ncbi:helix-turn-helix domain-containing protein [Arthrobacter rhombi]|uniref:helix-turn-helix domain-containing protein n=1 Tax=Arthrobacter rhombi TaxID=71253 RepID=UPI003FD63A9E
METRGIDAAMVGERIRSARKRRGWTQLELAREAGVSRKFLGDLEAGHPGASLGLTLIVLNKLDLNVTAGPHERDFRIDFESTLSRGDYDFALRLLGEYAQRVVEEGPSMMITRAPRIKDQAYRAALAAITRWAATKVGSCSPRWAKDSKPASSPMFPSEKLHPMSKAMKDLIRRETPRELASMNVWMRERDLTRA